MECFKNRIGIRAVRYGPFDQFSGTVSHVYVEENFKDTVAKALLRIGLDADMYIAVPLSEGLFVIPEALRAKPAILVEKMECDKDLDIPVWKTYKDIIAKYDDRGAEAVGNIDRFDFYDEAKDCYCILQSGESQIYANIILQKGVIK